MARVACHVKLPAWLLGLAIIAAVMACRKKASQQESPQGSQLASQQASEQVLPPFTIHLVECPHNWKPYLDSAEVPGQLTVPGRITNVPEFHDCQRFVATATDGFTYLPLFAIFAAEDLASRWDSVLAHPSFRSGALRIEKPIDSVSGDLARTAKLLPANSLPGVGPAPRHARSARSGWALVEVLSEGMYAPLGIGPGFNCAYFYMTGRALRARMVHFQGRHEPRCDLPVDPDTLAGYALEVRRTKHPGHRSSEDYPATARWDWDSVHRIQYFGVKCGDAWCEVGYYGFVPSTLPSLPTTADAAATYWQRVRHIKGWFDQQRLAPALVANPVAPDAGWGTVFADPLLVTRTVADFTGNWVPVARARLDPSLAAYESKLNLTPAGADHENLVYLCKGEWKTCSARARLVPDLAPGPIPEVAPNCPTADDVAPADIGAWWAGTVSAKGTVGFACTIRRDHSSVLAALGLKPTGTVRWRWRDQDETIWTSCDAGCCEVQRLK